MKRINYGETNYLVGDEVADLLVRYTARLAAAADADAVEVNVLGPDGNAEVATFALGPGITMTAETTRSDIAEPDNAAAVEYMEAGSLRLTRPTVTPMTAEDVRATVEEFDREL